MIKNIRVQQYRKLKDMDLAFSESVNAVSGTNGTCKSSILYLISNSFQKVSTKCDWVKDKKCLSIIHAVNSVANPKIESLTRGDMEYNDPAIGVTGTLFTVDYYGHNTLDFRRHNSKYENRYAVKPKYRPGTDDILPYCPVIYLGLSRLFPFGEYYNDEAIIKLKDKLPVEYQNEISKLYESFTKYSITYDSTAKMGDIKKRANFKSGRDGIDSNTISAGEDNLFIILTALVSLKYYYESIESSKQIESILLIDELDATLHPYYQIKLLELFYKFSKEYKIQIIFTTHSMSLLENMLKHKDNVLYLCDNETSVFVMTEPDIYKIKMHLHSLTSDDIYLDKVIPIFTEDAEARHMLEMILSYFENEGSYKEFIEIRRFFHLVDTNIGANNLKGIFNDTRLLRTTMKAICILDGDQNKNIGNCIITLPGQAAPEKLLIDYATKLLDDDDIFWRDQMISNKGYNKMWYRENIKDKETNFNAELEQRTANGQSNRGCEREFYKKMYNDNKSFFELLYKHWLRNSDNQVEIDSFYKDLNTMFKKVSTYNEINPNEWEIQQR